MTNEETPSETPAGIMRRINKISTAIVLLKESQAAAPTRTIAVELQALQVRREGLRKDLPALRVVT